MSAPSPSDIRRMQALAQQVTLRGPQLLNADATVGELAWLWARDIELLGPFWRHRLWTEGDDVVAWGWVCLPYRIPREDGGFAESSSASLLWQAHPDRPELLSEVLDWYDGLAGHLDRRLTVQSADGASQAAVAAHGYRYDQEAGADDGHWTQFNVRDLDRVATPVLPEGFRFVSAAEISVAEAVAAHRGAWSPTRLDQAAFERVRSTWPYRADLHVLLKAPDGRLAASAITWLDEATRSAEFEPVGTHRDFRRLGLGTALLLHGMHKARAAGAERVLVACLGAPARPEARRMYEGVGFRPLGRDLPQIKTAGLDSPG